MRNSRWLALYLNLTRFAAPVARIQIRRRLRRGKEDPTRYIEKLGSPSLHRPKGLLAWMHGVGVGELLALTSLARAMQEEIPELEILFTSVSLSSADAISRSMPPRSRHQFLPADCPEFVHGFLEHWRPDIAVCSERDIWPRLTIESKAHGIPLALVNGRMNSYSFRSKMRVRSAYRELYEMFDVVEAQDEGTARRLLALGASKKSLRVAGTLKSGGWPLFDLPEERRRFERLLAHRRVWIAASTHDEDEIVVAEAHRRILGRCPETFLAIIPRDISRCEAIARELERHSISCQVLVGGAVPEEIRSQACVVDAYGQLGIWYRLAASAFIGGSIAKIGGHNPYEAARLDCAILHGPNTENFSADYEAFDECGAARLIRNAHDLAEAVLDPDLRKLAMKAKAVANRGDDALRKTATGLARLMKNRPTSMHG
ncbi:MAG: 3-deoxy-D-manno-octulosonic acid transferase [Albidovulum sp.]|nr:3-deoxy-D-manno-octulosonic acid transferase [Albidovulum sp.]